MKKVEAVRFKPMIDWSTWGLIALVLISCGWPVFLDPGWLMIAVLSVCAALCLIPFFGTWYEIDGEDLIVYMFWRPSRFPVSMIKEISPVKTILSAPATSLTQRIAVSFTDRKVMKSSDPLIISPADRSGFIAALLSINPSIIVR